jgi:hypothetical protein
MRGNKQKNKFETKTEVSIASVLNLSGSEKAKPCYIFNLSLIHGKNKVQEEHSLLSNLDILAKHTYLLDVTGITKLKL